MQRDRETLGRKQRQQRREDEVQSTSVEQPPQEPKGSLHGAVERAEGVDERPSVGGAPVEVQRAVDPSPQGGRGAGGARNIQGSRGEGDAGVPSQVGHPHRAHNPREGEWLHRQRWDSPLQGGCHKAQIGQGSQGHSRSQGQGSCRRR